MITYQVEAYDACRLEIDALLEMHWREVGVDHADLPLAKDEAAYVQLALSGQLHIVTVRCDGALVGYHASIIKPHLHYCTTLCAFVDVYYLRPECRRGRAGVQLLIEAERSLRARGVVKVFSGTKLHLDMSRLYERLGWTAQDVMFSKVLRPIVG